MEIRGKLKGLKKNTEIGTEEKNGEKGIGKRQERDFREGWQKGFEQKHMNKDLMRRK